MECIAWSDFVWITNGRCNINVRVWVLDICLDVTVFKSCYIADHYSEGKSCLHDGSDSGPGPGTYFSQKQALVLHSVSINNIEYFLHYGRWCDQWLYWLPDSSSDGSGKLPAACTVRYASQCERRWNWTFPRFVSRLPHTLRYYFCELLGNIILSACLVWGFVAALGTNGIILQIHSKFP